MGFLSIKILLGGKRKMEKVMLTGVRPSGNLTLGNYLGAIKNFVDRQNSYKSYIFVCNFHIFWCILTKIV